MKYEALAKIRKAKESGATELYLTDDNISSITLLAGMTKMVTLSLPENKITDLTPLVKLTNLTHLQLSSNQITDIAPLAGLTKLKTLYLADNPMPENQKKMLQEALPNCQIFF